MLNRRRVALTVLLLDLSWIVLSLGMSYAVRYPSVQPSPSYFYVWLGVAGLGTWIVLFRTMRLAGFEANWRLIPLAGRIALATLLLMSSVLSLSYLDKLYYSRLLLGYYTIFLFVGFMVVRVGTYRFLRNNYSGLASRVVLVGNNRVTREFAFRISRHPEFLYQLVGVLTPVKGANGAEVFGQQVSTLSSIDALSALRQNRVDELIILEHTAGVEFETFITRCRSDGIRVSVVPHGYELYTSKPVLADIYGLPVVSLQAPDPFPHAASVKRVADLIAALLLAIPAALIVSVPAILLLRNKRAAFRREVRVGKHGVEFGMYRLNIDRQVTGGSAFERWLNEFSISELPQIWNVIKGDMSLVGPRPESPDKVRHYSEWQRERLKAVPGITGLAQVNGLREQHTSEEKSRFDLRYILEWSPLLDATLLLKTVGTLARRCLTGESPANVIPFPAQHHSDPHSQQEAVRHIAHADRA